MNVEQFLILLGGIIIAGFIGNLVFRYLKIPSVLLLIGLGILLGPILHLVPTDPLLQIAPYFGTIALLIILFEGGLDLEIRKVIEEAGSTLLLTIAVFLFSYVLIFVASFFLLKLPLLASLLLAGIMGGTSPAIILPVVSQLRMSKNLRTMLSIEPALADTLIIISVLLTIQIHQAGTTDFFTISKTILNSFLIGIAIAVLAGVIWARFISTLREEKVSYMLTLGFLFLLFVVLEHSGGSGAVGILFFGVILANVESILRRFSGKIRRLLGVKVDATKYALDQFVHNITIEISFLVRTFFFVFLGLLIDLKQFTIETALVVLLFTALLLVGRFLGAQLLFRLRPVYSLREKLITIAMMPRGLATAVMAFVPVSLGLPGTENFIFYALGVIVLSSFVMSAMVALIEMKFPAEKTEESETTEEPDTPAAQHSERESAEEILEEQTVLEEKAPAPHRVMMRAMAKHIPIPQVEEKATETEHAEDRTATLEEPEPSVPGIADRLMRWFGISFLRFRELDYIATQALNFRDSIYWLRVGATTVLVTFGFQLDLPIIIVLGLFFAPISSLINTLSFSLTTGDVYLFLKSTTKLVLTTVISILLSVLQCLILPLLGVPQLLSHFINPTLLDFLLATFSGIILVIGILRGRSSELQLLNPLIGYSFFLPIVAFSFSLASLGILPDAFTKFIGSILLFTANLTGLLLGSAIMLVLLNVTHHEASEYIAEWKQAELGSHWLRKLFVESRLAKFLGATGTIRSRLFILFLIAAALMIPLQRTVNEITLHYRASQVLNTIANEMFEKPDRSSVLAIQYEIKNNRLIARVRITTSEFYKQNEIEEFEKKVEERLGIPVQLFLIQSPGSIGGSPAENLGFTTAERARSFPEKLNLLIEDLNEAIRTIPSAAGIQILQIAPVFSPATQETQIELVYIHRQKLSEETASLIQALVAQTLQIPPYSVVIRWLPDYFTGLQPNIQKLVNPETQLPLQKVIEQYRNLYITIYLPQGQDPDLIQSQLEEQITKYIPSDRILFIPGGTEQYEVFISVSSAVAQGIFPDGAESE